MGWVYTDDPEDPCSLCVQWMDPDEEAHRAAGEFGEDGMGMEFMQPCMPRFDPPGIVVAERVFSGIHPECQESVDRMEWEREHV
jgi:hypothetical protein